MSVFAEHRRKGFAGDAIVVLCRYFFDELRFHKVHATVYAFNEPSLGLHRSLGFQEEGRLRAVYFTNGEYHDEVIFGMTSSEFRERWG